MEIMIQAIRKYHKEMEFDIENWAMVPMKSGKKK